MKKVSRTQLENVSGGYCKSKCGKPVCKPVCPPPCTTTPVIVTPVSH